ncbi:MAG: DUF1385 domain-containing protein, partial [Acidobacteriota bacterium]
MSEQKEIIVGGQAVIEGVMMRGPNSWAVAVRRPDGLIVSKAEPLPSLSARYPILKVPVLRGSAVLIHSMVLGIRAINFSAAIALDEGAESEGNPRPAQTLGAAGSIISALFFNILLFVVLPLLLTNALFLYFGWGNNPGTPETVGGGWFETAWSWWRTWTRPVRPSVSFNLIDGLIRMALFLVMIWSFSKLEEIRRLFEYHGAEHKTVFTWEAGAELTVENASRYPRQHPRCGTSFLMVVMLVSIVLFSIVKFDSLLLNLLTRVVLIPLVAGISYEIIKAAGQKETSSIFRLMTLPGLWLQNVTTREPSPDQLEVAIHALRESLKLEPQPVPSGLACQSTAAGTR